MKPPKTLLALLLCLAILASPFPAACAEDAAELPPELDLTEPQEEEPGEAVPDAPDAEEAGLPSEDEAVSDGAAPFEGDEASADADEAGDDTMSEVFYGELPLNIANDELLTQYVRVLFGLPGTLSLGAARPELVLGEADYYVEQQLKAGVSKIADGTRSSTAVTVTLSPYRYSDLNMDAILDALVKDATYELYWSDRSYGWSWSSVTLEVTFHAAPDYQGASTSSVDSAKIQAAQQAVSNANALLARYADSGLSDYELLRAYKNELLALTGYNYAAASGGSIRTTGSNPWELVYVFDGDPSTTVVCEGYSKAFEYLCNRTVFRSTLINCICVDGTVYWRDGSVGGHMWNIVTMDDGRNYLVDVTNDWGNEYRFLLPAVSGSAESHDGYLFSTGDRYSYYQLYYSGGEYVYEEDVFSAFPPDMLVLSELPYGTAAVTVDLNGDGALDSADFALLAQALKARGIGVTLAASGDVNGDGIVNGADLVALAKLAGIR